jgi:hypothetical protein
MIDEESMRAAKGIASHDHLPEFMMSGTPKTHVADQQTPKTACINHSTGQDKRNALGGFPSKQAAVPEKHQS